MTPILDPLAALYVLLLGLALGLTLLAATAYLRIGPVWLRGLLMLSAAWLACRYLAMFLFAVSPNPHEVWLWRYAWFGSAVGLTFPAAVAVDQLVRHPAMTPKKLLRWYAPFFLGYVLIIALGRFTLTADPVVGAAPKLVGWGRWAIGVVQSAYVLGLAFICFQLMRKLPSKPIRLALGGLLLAFAYLAVDGALLAAGQWYFRPFLYSELLTLAAIWFALETARVCP